MTDLYTELITNVNAAINTIEEGEIIVVNVSHAEYAENADRVGNAESAEYANEVNKTSNATFANVSADVPISAVGSCSISSGVGSLSNGVLENKGVYLVVYKNVYSTYYVHTYTGVIIYKSGKNATTRLSNCTNRYGGSLRVVFGGAGNHRVDILMYDESVSSFATGKVCFYKIGTIE